MAWKPQKKKKENANEFTVWTWRSNKVVVELKFQFNIVFENAEHVESQSEIKGKNEILKIGKRRKEKKRLERLLIYQWDEDGFLKRMKAWEWFFTSFHYIHTQRERERERECVCVCVCVFMYELGLAFWFLVLLLLHVGLSSCLCFKARWLIKEVWVLLKCAVRAHLVSKNTQNYTIFEGYHICIFFFH